MNKKGWIIVLVIILLLGNLGPLAYADNNQPEARANQVTSPAITISWLQETHGIDENWISEKLGGGVSLYQIHRALSEHNHVNDADKFLSNLQVESSVQYQGIQTAQAASILAANPAVDEAALKQARVQDDASLYLNHYGDDAVSMSSGALYVAQTDIELPGMIPFELTRIYDSSKANGEIGIREDAASGRIVNESFIRRDEITSSLGRGWSWDLPYIQEIDGIRYLYFSGAGTFALSDSLDIIGYHWNDMQLVNDRSVNVNGLQGEYKLSILNGYIYYFDARGYLIQIQDLYGNTVSFHYEPLPEGPVLKRVVNSEGNALQFNYTTLGLTVELEGTDRKVEYRKVQQKGYTLLGETIDSLSRSTSYVYSLPESRFNLLSDLVGVPDQHKDDGTALLTRIIYPTSRITDIQYNAYMGLIGDYATRHVFRVSSRKDTYSTTSGVKTLGLRNFDYSGEDLGSFGRNVDMTTTVLGGKWSETYKISKTHEGNASPSLQYLKEYRLSGDAAGYVQEFEYDATDKKNMPRRVTESHLQNSIASQSVTTTYTYDEHGFITSKNSSTGEEESYEYEQKTGSAAWKKPSVITVKMNDRQSRVTQFEYDDQGSVTTEIVSEGVGRASLSYTEYIYDTYGNLSQSRVRDNSRVIEQSYQYESPHGRHLRTSESVIVRDASSRASTVSNHYSYWPTGELKSETDNDGNVSSYAYDKAAELRQSNIAMEPGPLYSIWINLTESLRPQQMVLLQQSNTIRLVSCFRRRHIKPCFNMNTMMRAMRQK